MYHERSIYSVTPQKTEITSFIFLLPRDKLPVHHLVALETTVTKDLKKHFFKTSQRRRCLLIGWLVSHHVKIPFLVGCKLLKQTLGLMTVTWPARVLLVCHSVLIDTVSLLRWTFPSISMVVTSSSVEDQTVPTCRMVQSEPWIASALLRKNKS